MAQENIKTKQKTNSVIKEKFEIKLPKNYKIVLLNNNITAFEAVVDVLKEIFNKNQAIASQIMMKAHTEGKALVEAPVSKEMGEMKIKEAEEYCQKRENEMSHPNGMSFYYTQLKFEVEEDQ